MRNTLTQLENEKEKLLKEIEEKGYDYSYYINMQNNSESLASNIKLSQCANNTLELKKVQKTKDFKGVLVFIVSYINQIVKLLHLNFGKVTCFIHYFKYFSVENENYSLNFNDITFDYDFYQFTLKLISGFAPIVFLFFSNTFDMISNKIHSGSNEENNDDTYSQPSSPKPDHSFCYNIFEVARAFNKSVKQSSAMIVKTRKMTRNSIEILRKLDDIINSCQLNNDSKTTDRFKLESSPNKIYLSYLTYYENKKSSNEKVKAFVNQHPRRSKVFISKYSNHLVKTEHIEKPKARIGTLHPLFVNGKTSEELPEQENSFDEATQQLQKKTKMIKKRRRLIESSNEREKHVIFDRMNDLFKLELNYFKNRDKTRVNTDKINKMYYQFKKSQEKLKIAPKIKRKQLGAYVHMVNIIKNKNHSMKQSPIAYPTEDKCYPLLHKNSSVENIGSNLVNDNESTTMTYLIPNNTQNIFNSTRTNYNNYSLSKTMGTNETQNSPFNFAKGFNKNKGKTSFSALRKTITNK